MSPSQHHVAVLGASPKPARYANQAVRLLLQQGYQVTPLHPNFAQIEGLDVVPSIDQVGRPIDTLTLYVGPDKLQQQIDLLVAAHPRRVIFNPGTESRPVQQAFDQAGIEWLEACTLVMLKTKQF